MKCQYTVWVRSRAAVILEERLATLQPFLTCAGTCVSMSINFKFSHQHDIIMHAQKRQSDVIRSAVKQK